MDDKLAVDVIEAARRMSVPERTVWGEIAAERLRSFKVGRHRLIRVADIEAYLERRAALAEVPDAPLVRPSRQPRRAAASSDGILVPFPDLEPSTDRVASSAASHRAARSKKARSVRR